MAKSKEDKDGITKLPVPAPEPQTGCVVCGSYEGTFTGSAGNARWHAECEAAHPVTIRKVKARA